MGIFKMLFGGIFGGGKAGKAGGGDEEGGGGRLKGNADGGCPGCGKRGKCNCGACGAE